MQAYECNYLVHRVQLNSFNKNFSSVIFIERYIREREGPLVSYKRYEGAGLSQDRSRAFIIARGRTFRTAGRSETVIRSVAKGCKMAS